MIGVLINPHARAAKRAGLVAAVERAVGGDSVVRITGTLAELDAAVAELARRNIDVLAGCGGDGTHVAIIGAMRRVYGDDLAGAPPYLFLPGGTMNTVAGNLGARGAPEERLTRWRTTSPTITRHTLVTAEDDGERRSGFIFAAAMGARFLEAYYAGFGGVGATGRMAGLLGPGPIWAAALGLRTAASCLVQGPWARTLFGPLAVTLTVDDDVDPTPGPFRLLVASAVVDVGLGMRVAWRAGQEPGRVHLVASGVTPLGLGLQLPRVLTGRPLHGAPHVAHVDRSIRRATLRFLAPTVYTLDGELFNTTELTLTAGPDLRVLNV